MGKLSKSKSKSKSESKSKSKPKSQKIQFKNTKFLSDDESSDDEYSDEEIVLEKVPKKGSIKSKISKSAKINFYYDSDDSEPESDFDIEFGPTKSGSKFGSKSGSKSGSKFGSKSGSKSNKINNSSKSKKIIKFLVEESEESNSEPNTKLKTIDKILPIELGRANSHEKKKISEAMIDKLIENDAENDDNITFDSYEKAKDFLKKHKILISTITLDCKLEGSKKKKPILIDIDNFAKNVVLKEDGIVSIKFGNRKDPATNRTIVIVKSKKKPSIKNFYNQVTILMKPMNNLERNYINIKVFKNGSLQMTGCKDMDDFYNVTKTLIDILTNGKDEGRKTHIDFINQSSIKIQDVKIRMINSNFRLDYKVDRKKLAKLLKKNHHKNTKNSDIGYVECKYEPTSGHSCVNIKYKYDETSKPSIFVFQTGAIIITGAKNLHHIIMAYRFIHTILKKYYNQIRIIDLDQNAVQKEIAKFFNNKFEQKVDNKNLISNC